VGPLRQSLGLALFALCSAVFGAGCPVPDDGTSLRRGLLKVKYLPETEAWEREAGKAATVQYVLLVGSAQRVGKHCYWPVQARAGGELWNTFYVTARGERVLVAAPTGKLLTLEDWRAARR
jgi:hypothetical protein